MKIDLHTHILPHDWPDLDAKCGYAGFVRLDHHRPCCARMMIGDRFFREIGDNAWDPERRLEECDRAGVSVQVLSTVPVMFSYWAKPADGLDLSRRLNDHIAEVVRAHPARFAGLGTIPLQGSRAGGARAGALRARARSARRANRHHIDANPHLPNGPTAQSRRSFARSGLAGRGRIEARRSSFIPGTWSGKERMPKYWLPWLVGMPAETSLAICSMMFGGVFDRFPRLRVAFAHGGGAFPFTIGRIEHGFNVRPDLVAIDNQINPRSYLRASMSAARPPRRALRRFVSPRSGRTRLSPQAFRRGSDRARLGLSLPVRRSASRRALDRVDARFLLPRKNAAAERKRARSFSPSTDSN